VTTSRSRRDSVVISLSDYRVTGVVSSEVEEFEEHDMSGRTVLHSGIITYLVDVYVSGPDEETCGRIYARVTDLVYKDLAYMEPRFEGPTSQAERTAYGLVDRYVYVVRARTRDESNINELCARLRALSAESALR
jgi:hypothetical protein